ncbi:MAG: DUF4230 domain-containing protein [Oscillospiraceae bacterium]|nr:DUF4230 domain-containing protein [Oscillospiraceae bacterium]
MKKLLVGFVIGIAAAAITVAAVAAAFLLRGNSGTANSTVVNVSSLQQRIVSIGELATVAYDYTNVVDSQDSLAIKGWDVPLTKKSFIVVLDGTMKIGIDASGISVDADEEEKAVLITILSAKILSHEIHEKTLRVLDEKSGLFNPVHIEDYTTLAALQKQAMEDKVSEGDMFARAESDAVKMLRTLIDEIVPAEYTVTVAVSAAEEPEQ